MKYFLRWFIVITDSTILERLVVRVLIFSSLILAFSTLEINSADLRFQELTTRRNYVPEINWLTIGRAGLQLPVVLPFRLTMAAGLFCLLTFQLGSITKENFSVENLLFPAILLMALYCLYISARSA